MSPASSPPPKAPSPRPRGPWALWAGLVLALVPAGAPLGCSPKPAPAEGATPPAHAQRPPQAAATAAPAKPTAKTPAAAPTGASAPGARASAAGSPRVHDPAHPPIDCPLREAGVDPSKMKPFEETEAYIAFLERADRAAWQRPDEVVAALGLRGDETVVDVGAGSGYFAFRFARAVPRGRVIAADVEPEMVRHVHHKAMMEGTGNLEARVVPPSEPQAAIPPGADLVFVCDVLHHVPDPAAWLGKIAAALPSGGRLALIEFKEGEIPQGPPKALKIPHARLVSLATGAGLTVAEDRRDLLPYQTFLVFRKP